MTEELLSQHSELLLLLDDNNNDVFQQLMFNRLQIVKEEIMEVVGTTQFARGINFNLLDKEEITRLVTEPY